MKTIMKQNLNNKLTHYLLLTIFFSGLFLSGCARDKEDSSTTPKVSKPPILENQQDLGDVADNSSQQANDNANTEKDSSIQNVEKQLPPPEKQSPKVVGSTKPVNNNTDNRENDVVVNDKVEVEDVKTSNTCQLPKNVPDDTHLDDNTSFKQWLTIFKNEAIRGGLSNTTINAALSNVYPIQKVITFDRRQAEYTITFSKYLRNSISTKRITDGKRMLRNYRALLANIEKQYGVQPQFLIALWAMESNFGKNMGNFSTINTLATLAHEGRRRHFFRNELLCALHIIQQKHIRAAEMESSWAGAMGQPQFMPSTFYYYAVDGDGDGKKDIWHNVTDVFASAANYLKAAGWQPKQSWGVEIKLPSQFDFYQARLSEQKSLQQWHQLGVTKANGQPLTGNRNIKGSIVLPSGRQGHAFLVFQNFRVLREWNRSINYALTVGYLSDRLTGKGKLIGRAPKGEKPLSRKQVLSLQRHLKKLGFYHDKIDGMIGVNSRKAIRNYQKSRNLPADAYPSPLVIAQLQQDVNRQSSSASDFYSVNKDTSIDALLIECSQHLREKNLTTNEQGGGTAFECYNQVLSLSPNNPDALQGLKAIEEKYYQWAVSAAKQGKHLNFNRYFLSLQKVNPKSPRLNELKNLQINKM